MQKSHGVTALACLLLASLPENALAHDRTLILTFMAGYCTIAAIATMLFMRKRGWRAILIAVVAAWCVSGLLLVASFELKLDDVLGTSTDLPVVVMSMFVGVLTGTLIGRKLGRRSTR